MPVERGRKYVFNLNQSERNIPKIGYTTFQENVSFILSHFEQPLFPRTISTLVTGGRQRRAKSPSRPWR
jgi:hypothetical protein